MYKIRTNNKRKSQWFISSCRSLSQTLDESDKFTDNIEMNLDLAAQNNPHVFTGLGHFMAKSWNWFIT